MAEITEKEKERLKRIKAFNQYRDLIINKIKSLDESGFKRNWFKDNHLPQNINGRDYDNINSIVLSLHSEQNNFKSSVYITQKQIKDDKLFIKKGEKSIMISTKVLKFSDENNNEITAKEYSRLSAEEKTKYKRETEYRYYPVFNIEQTNFPEKQPEAWNIFIEKYSASSENKNAHSSLDKIIDENDWICNIERTDKNSYSWIDDTLSLSSEGNKDSDYYSTLLHCMSQSTTHPSRLGVGFDKIGDERYMKNELVSSLSSAYVSRCMGFGTGVCSPAQQYASAWASELEKDSSFIYSMIYELNTRNRYLKSSVLSLLKKENPIVAQEPANMISFERREGSSIIYAQGITSSGKQFESPVYHRGNDYCYTTGSVITGDLKTFYLTPQEIATVEGLRNFKQADSLIKMIVKTSRKSITFNSESATIDYMGKEYNADNIIKVLKDNGINPKSISENVWKNLLMGQGVQIDRSKKSIFSIIKTPQGYGMRVANVAKKVAAKSVGNEITNE